MGYERTKGRVYHDDLVLSWLSTLDRQVDGCYFGEK